ncbi:MULTISPECIES: hypothetical protein [unclassified Nocardia]|uniref:hypothetical protein n=1 Tax=unclassified Nocardia TaxID=2637762 RepID=UPI0033B36EF1
MAVGWGVSIGARNTVCAVLGGGDDPVVRRDRTGSRADRILGFADLTIAGGLSLEPPAEELVVRVLGDAMAAHGAVAEHTVLTVPAVYDERHLAALRRELGRARLGEVALVAEPIAAAAVLDRPDETAAAAPDPATLLVYDLGATSLDLAVVVRDGRGHRIAGRPARSYAFGGRSTAAALAVTAHDLAEAEDPGAAAPDPGHALAVRDRLVRDSLPLVHECLRTAGLSAGRLDAVLLVGGAASPVDVAHALADALRCPVLREPVPGESIARGAALLGARRSAAGTVLVPVRRPISRGALVAAAIAVPLLFSAALGLLRADDGRGGALVAAPGRALPAVPGEHVGAAPVSGPEHALPVVPASRWTPRGAEHADLSPSDPSVADLDERAPDRAVVDSSAGSTRAESIGFAESSASVPVTYPPTTPDSATPGHGVPSDQVPWTLTVEIPSQIPIETHGIPADPGQGMPIEAPAISAPQGVPVETGAAAPDSVVPDIASVPDSGVAHP